GTGIAGFSGDGGLARNAMFSFAVDIRFDSSGNLLVADGGNHRIRKIDPSGIVTTIAGNGLVGNSGDGGPALAAELNSPFGLSLHAVGNVYFGDALGCVVRRIDLAGIITTVAGNGICAYGGDNGPATNASLNEPRGILVGPRGNLYIADTFNHRV